MNKIMVTRNEEGEYEFNVSYEDFMLLMKSITDVVLLNRIQVLTGDEEDEGEEVNWYENSDSRILFDPSDP